jgi:hypothetical protein
MAGGAMTSWPVTMGLTSFWGGNGRDRLIGRAGNDQFDAHSSNLPFPAADHDGNELVSCGPGEDRIIRVTARDFLTPDCEHIWPDFFAETITDPIISISPPSRGARLRYTVRCRRYREGIAVGPANPGRRARCSGQIRATRPDNPARILAHGSFPAGKWSARDLTARLTRLGQRLTRRDRGVEAVLTLRVTAQHGDGPHTDTIAWTTRLRR